MRSPLSWLLRLYPRAWRDRYGHEFEALVDDTGHPWRHATDIFLEAMKLRLAAQNWRVIGAFGLLGLMVAFTITSRMTPRYVSQAVLQVRLPSGLGPEDSMRQIIQLGNQVLGSAPPPEVHISVQAGPKPGSNRALSIQFSATDPVIARARVQHLVTRFVDENQRAGGRRVPFALEVLDPPNLPVDPASPNRMRILLFGLIGGMLLGKAATWRPGWLRSA